jgi:hypothetical protein
MRIYEGHQKYLRVAITSYSKRRSHQWKKYGQTKILKEESW